MNVFLIFAFLFFMGSVVGWGIELVYRRFFSQNNPERRWINPGFLNGPYVPLYGLGLCTLYLLARIHLPKILLFLVMALSMTAIEYAAGVLFIEGMGVKLWDYSGEKWNIRGLICPKFSFFWAVLGAIYYFAIDPHILDSLRWLSGHLAFSFFIGLFFGVFIIDFVSSVQLLNKIKAFAKENNLEVRYEELKALIGRLREKMKEKRRFLLAFRSELSIRDVLQKYKEAAERGEFRLKKLHRKNAGRRKTEEPPPEKRVL